MNVKKYINSASTSHRRNRTCFRADLLEILFEFVQWIGLRENLQETPIFNGKIYGFL
jgi:hypothetical protein